MLKKYKLLIITTFILIFCFSSAYSKSENLTIKVAILDNFHFQPNITNNAGKNYLEGINLANHLVEEEGYYIKYRLFKYGRKNPLAILSTIKTVKNWNPDVILGPRNSNMFLLIQNSFSDVLVLSPFATSDKVQDMPKNYYSLMYADKFLANAIGDYISKKYPEKGVYSIVEVDCKNCVDVGRDFADFWKIKHSKIPLITKKYVQSNVDKIDIKSLMDGYKKDDLILLPNTAYSSAILMTKITNYLNQSSIFIGGDDWGSWENTVVGKLKASKYYYGLHFTPSSLDVNDEINLEFKNNFYAYYMRSPTENASLLGYTAIFSIIEALKKYSKFYQTKDVRSLILNSYTRALKENPNWFKPNKYAIYKVDNIGETYLEAIPVTNNGNKID